MGQNNTDEPTDLNLSAPESPLPRRHKRDAGISTPKEWVGLRELTHYADISERTLRSWIYSPVDPLPAVKVCGKVLVRRSDFDAFLHRHRVRHLEELNLGAIVKDVLQSVAHGR